MVKGDKVLGLREQREITRLIKDLEAYLTPGIEDGAGHKTAAHKPLVGSHDDLIHELGDPADIMQRYCPSCFYINATRRIKEILAGAAEPGQDAVGPPPFVVGP